MTKAAGMLAAALTGLLGVACVPEYATVELQGRLDIEDARYRIVALDFKNDHWGTPGGGREVSVAYGKLVESEVYGLEEPADAVHIEGCQSAPS